MTERPIERVHWDRNVYTLEEIIEMTKWTPPRHLVEDPPTLLVEGVQKSRTCGSCQFQLVATPDAPTIRGRHLCRRGDELFLVDWA